MARQTVTASVSGETNQKIRTIIDMLKERSKQNRIPPPKYSAIIEMLLTRGIDDFLRQERETKTDAR